MFAYKIFYSRAYNKTKQNISKPNDKLYNTFTYE